MIKFRKRFFSFLILFSMIVAIPVNSFANENENISDNTSTLSASTPIVGKATTTVYQMKLWAKSKGANQIFIDLAGKFYDISVSRGVDPAVTYTQSAKETNFMKFTGVLDSSYNNPCGMKNSAGGGDYDGEAHKRFASWNDGILAQVDHLALYSGKPGYPKYSSDLHQWYKGQGKESSYNVNAYKKNGTTTDPRHFSSIYGKCPTVESLGANWAPSPTYGDEVVKFMNELYKFPYSTVTRYAGSDRYATSALINKSVGTNSKIAVISSGNSFPDTIVASILAGQFNANMFINKPNSLTVEINTAIESGSLETVYSIGGNALPTSVKNKIRNKGIDLINISGPNRFDTSASVAENSENKSKVFLANGNNFPDSLSIAPLALREGYSLVLTDGSNLTTNVSKILNEAEEVVIVGGTGSVSSPIENRLLKNGKKVSRISGSNRYDTSMKIASNYYKNTDFVLAASGNNYADALTGTVLANKLNAPIILVSGNSLNSEQKSYLNSQKINTLYILGGSGSVSSNLEKNIKSILDK